MNQRIRLDDLTDDALDQLYERAETAENRLRLAHQARRAKEHQLDGIRRALCDAGLMQDDDPYSHADLEDVIRKNAPDTTRADALAAFLALPARQAADAEAAVAQLRRERDGINRMYLTAMGDLGILVNRLDRLRASIHIADAEDVTDWQRGYRACVERVLAVLDCKTSPKAAPKAEPTKMPDTVTDPEWLRQQYAATIDAAFESFDPDETEDAQIYGHLADAVMRVRDRHLDQLRQRLQLAEYFHQDIRTVQQRAERAEAALARVLDLVDECEARGQSSGHPLTVTRIREALDQPPAARQPLDQPTEEQTVPDWTPPPPGDTREQLPDHILNLIRDCLPDYTSTACQTADTVACAATYPGSGVPRPLYDEIREHAERLHQRCRLNHKFTGQLCVCGCH